MLRIRNITIQKVRTLFSAATDDLQMEKLNEVINSLAGTDVILILIISLVNHMLSLIKWFENCAIMII